MLPTFVIGLREGLEASLIVGIIATFLAQQGRRDVMRWVWLGVGIAVSLCTAAAVALRIAEENLPQKQQEGLETVIGLLAVAMVTWMIIWMRRHARGLKFDLEDKTAAALAGGSVGTLVFMAFLAVLREGLETAVFLLAAFQSARNPTTAGTGAALGVIVSVIIGVAIYRGGIKLNLEKFFRFTGFVLVLVAAGLLATAAHTAHEAGWLNAGQQQMFNLTWLVNPGSIQSALLTGMLGIQPRPVRIEVVVYLLYLIPMSIFVLRPPRPRRDGSTDRAASEKRAASGKRTAVGATALVAVVALSACGSSGSKSGDGDSNVKTVAIELVEKGCSPSKLTLPAGPTKFEVENIDAAAISEFEILNGVKVMGEVENIPPGLRKSFSLTLKPGKFAVWCPGGTEKDGRGTLVVTETAAATTTNATDAAARTAAIDNYRNYLVEQAALLTTTTKTFTDAVEAGDVEAAKAAYGPARIPYERIEPVAESFGDLDPDIDARANDVPAAKWGGFHKIEQALYVNGNLDGMTPVAQKLLADVNRLDTLVETVDLEPATIANGAVELLNEVSSSKITGEEERYSHIDLVDLVANVEGAQAAFDSVKDLLPAGATVSDSEIDGRFTDIEAAMEHYKDGDSYVPYTDLTKDQTRAIALKIDAAAEPLSKVAEQIIS